MITKWHEIPPMAFKIPNGLKDTNCPLNIPKIFHFKAFKNPPKLGF
jgi:hypothetical protein